MIRLFVASVALILVGSGVIAEERQVKLEMPKTLFFPQARSDSPPRDIRLKDKWKGIVDGGVAMSIGNQLLSFVSMTFKDEVISRGGQDANMNWIGKVHSGYEGVRVGDIFPVQDTLYRITELSDQGVNLELVTDTAVLEQYAPQPDSQCCSFSNAGPVLVRSKPSTTPSVLIRDYQGPDSPFGTYLRPRREGDLVRWPGLAGRMRLKRIVLPDRENHILGWLELQTVLPEEVARLTKESPQVSPLAANSDQIVIQCKSETDPDDRLQGCVQGAGWVYPWKNEPKAGIHFFEFCDLPGELRGAYGFASTETGDLIPVKGALYSISPLGPEVTLTRVVKPGYEKITPSRRSSILALNSTFHIFGNTFPRTLAARIGESEIVVIEHTQGAIGAPKTVTWLRYPILRDSVLLSSPAKETVSEGDIVELFEPSGKVPVRVQRIVMPDPEKHIVGWVELSPVDPIVK